MFITTYNKKRIKELILEFKQKDKELTKEVINSPSWLQMSQLIAKDLVKDECIRRLSLAILGENIWYERK